MKAKDLSVLTESILSNVQAHNKKDREKLPVPEGGAGGGGGGAPGGSGGGASGLSAGGFSGFPAAPGFKGPSGSSADNLGLKTTPVMGVVTADKAQVYKGNRVLQKTRRRKKKRKNESFTKAEELMHSITEAQMGNVRVWDNGEDFMVAIKAEHGWNVYSIKEFPHERKELEFFFHTNNSELKADKSWGKPVDFKKLPREISQVISHKVH